MTDERGLGFGVGGCNNTIWWIIIVIIFICLLCPGFFNGCIRE